MMISVARCIADALPLNEITFIKVLFPENDSDENKTGAPQRQVWHDMI